MEQAATITHEDESTTTESQQRPSLRYQSLHPIEHEPKPVTRILTLQCGQKGQPLVCTLEIANVQESSGSYEALSYVWGEEIHRESLICNGGSLQITPNLAEALQCLRYPDRPRRLWADAVCINQNCQDEKSRQVAYMRLVYKYARRVVIWLGPKDQNVERAFSFMRELWEESEEHINNAVLQLPNQNRNPQQLELIGRIVTEIITDKVRQRAGV